MATEIKMPQLGESVTEGTIGRWLKRPGERVEKYEALLEGTTDKVDTEVPAPEAGVLREIAVPEGTTVKVGTLLALLDHDGQAVEPSAQSAASNGAAPSEPAPEPAAEPAAPANTFVSPVVARLLAEHSLEVGEIAGTGQGGRVTKQDVLKFVELRRSQPSARPSPAPAARAAQPAPAAVAAPAPVAEDDDEIVAITPMRRSIAEHMLRSRRTAPHVTTVFEIDLSRVVAHRARAQADFARQGVKLTYTAYFVQAACAALLAVPSVNASYADEGIVQHRAVNIGVAVALDEGLIVPVIRAADEKNLLGLARAVNDLAERARARRLKPDETQDGTFTITNHGVGGSLFAMPIINQPQAAILGVGAIEKRVVVVSQDGADAIAIRPMCYLSLTIDHRLLDGAVADAFLSVVKRTLEDYAE